MTVCLASWFATLDRGCCCRNFTGHRNYLGPLRQPQSGLVVAVSCCSSFGKTNVWIQWFAQTSSSPNHGNNRRCSALAIGGRALRCRCNRSDVRGHSIVVAAFKRGHENRTAQIHLGGRSCSPAPSRCICRARRCELWSLLYILGCDAWNRLLFDEQRRARRLNRHRGQARLPA